MAPFSRRALGTCALYGILSIVFCLPFDSAQHFEYRQLPFWMWHLPQVAILSPASLLSAIVPLSLGIEINVVLHYWVAFLGMHLLLTRAIGLSFLPFVVFAASVFTLGGAMAMHLAVGDQTVLPVFYLPLLMFFVYRTARTGALRDALFAAGILALAIYNGGFQIVPMALMAVGAWAACVAVGARDWRPIAIAVLVVVCAAAYAGPKLAPVAEFVSGDQFRRTLEPIDHPDRMTPDMIWRAYTDSSLGAQSHVSGAQRHGWWEYGNYIGLLAASGIGLSVLWPLVVPSTTPQRSFAAMLALMAVWFLVVSAGEFHPFAPALGLARLPLVSSFRIPSRYTIAFGLFGALTIGAAARAAARLLPATPRLQRSVAVVCAIAVAELVFVNQRHFRNAASQTPVVNEIQTADAERPRVWSDGTAKVTDVVPTFNGARFSVIGGYEPSKVFLNQRYAPGWQSSAGTVRPDPQTDGRMFVQVAAGQTGRFSFSFVPPGLTAGMVLLFVAVAVSALVWNRRWSPVAFERTAGTRQAAERTQFADRAERVTKNVVLWSMAGAVMARAFVGGPNQTTLIVIVIGSFAIARATSARWEHADGIVLASMYVAPAVFSRFWVHDGSVYSMYLAAGLLGAIWPRWSRRQWSLPTPWRVPLVGWALTAAVGWPIIAAREVDFHPELAGILDMPNSTLGISARGAIAIAADAAAMLMLGIVWLDWLFERYANDGPRFRRTIILPLIVSGCIASVVAAYQLFGDMTFLNPGWAEFHRASATMVDANAFGMSAVLCSCGCLALIEGRRRTWDRLMLGGFSLSLIGAWASGSRTALVAEMIALAFAAQSLLRSPVSGDHVPRRHGRRPLVLAITSVAAAVLLVAFRHTGPVLRLGWILPTASLESIAGFTKQMLWVRAGYGTAAVEMIRSNPWFGVGIGSFPLIVGDYPFSHLGGPLAPDNAQNWIRHNLAELGLIGSIGWILWTVVLLIALFRRSGAWRDRRATIVAGTFVGVVVVSQVGMPTQNLAVAITFWTFLFWHCSYRWPTAAPPGRGFSQSWKWALMGVLLATFAAGTLRTSLTTLRPPMRARHAGWNYDYGFYLPERTADGEEYRWTKQNAVAVIPAASRAVKLIVWAVRADAHHPVMARVWHDEQLVIDTVLHDNRPVSADAVIDKNPQWLMIRTYLDRTLPESQPDLGLAVQWTFAGAPTHASTSVR